jgi:hypothetical protein
MSAILVGIDANKWFESGYVRDMTIRNNRFVRCAEPVVHIEPMNSKPNNKVHQNIRIENNQFLLRNELVLKAKSSNNISLKGNTIISEKELNDDLVIMIDDCSDMKSAENQFIVD